MDKHQVELPVIYDKHVPIVSTPLENGKVQTVIHIVREITEPSEYVEALTVMNNALEGDIVVFNLNTPGGRLDSTYMLLDAMEHTAATTVARITGEVASAGTMLVMKADSVEAYRWGSMMIHNFSGGFVGKGNEVDVEVAFALPHLKDFFSDTYRYFLTKKEISRVIKDHDIYMGATEIAKRFEIVNIKREKAFNKSQLEAEKENESSVIDYVTSLGYTVTKDK